MRTCDPLWRSIRARDAVAQRAPGMLVRLGRREMGWRQGDLGRKIGCSASTVSRLETGPIGDVLLLQRAARAVGVPGGVLGAALGLSGFAGTTVTPGPHRAEEDVMRRRSLLAVAGLFAPARLLSGVDEALAAVPNPTGSRIGLDARLVQARTVFDAGRYTPLLEGLPGLLGDAHEDARAGSATAVARLSVATA